MTGRPAATSGAAQRGDNDLVLSFLRVRRAIGILGAFLPAALIAWSVLSGTGIRSSMSAYYYSPMREVFVGTLCANAVFFWSYEGYRPKRGEWLSDGLATRIAAISAAIIALAPTLPASPVTGCALVQCVIGIKPAATLHLLAATSHFAMLALFCLVLFRRGDSDRPDKLASNRIYLLCGWIIVAALAGIALLGLTPLGPATAALRPVFWLEVAATWAFATSWLVKGDALRPLVRAARP